VLVAVAGGDHAKAQIVEPLDGRALLIGQAQPVARDCDPEGSISRSLLRTESGSEFLHHAPYANG